MRNTSTAALIALLLLSGCMSTAVKTENIKDTLTVVMARQDAYVTADDSLTEEQRALVLAQSAQIRNMLTWSEVSREQLAVLVLPMLDRHDAYVRMDSTLIALERRVYLRSSATLRQVATVPVVGAT